MQTEFWLNKWKNQDIGFHLYQVHPLLKKYYSKIFSKKKGVFVPLCGKTNDLIFFSANHHDTVGCELSENAAISFFSEQNLIAETASEHSFNAYHSGNIRILVGDYFDLTFEQIVACQNIYDRAALIALPADMRKSYVRKMKKLFKQAQMLLITLEYQNNLMNGPPFSVDEIEVKQLFDFAECKKMYEKNILSTEPKFSAKGLTYLNECAYFIRW